MKRVLLALAGVLVVYGAVLGGSAVWARTGLKHRPCPVSGAVVVVDSSAHTLSLCQGGRPQGVYRVALGRGGAGKRAEADAKTPRGSYPLSAARPSSRFWLFLPVGYPTAVQRQMGFTGSDIGIHGPHRAFFWLGHATVWVDWTAGCVAAGTRGDIEAIAEWVRTTGAREILIS